VYRALDDLCTIYPLPPTEIVDAGIWGTDTAILRINTHLKSEFADAVSNIERAGHIVTPAEEHLLRLILTHWCGWSATDRSHLDDAWVKCLQAMYAHLNGLLPVLDSLVWAEELTRYPEGKSPPEPSFFLLATPRCYYVYALDDSTLFRAGDSLEEVYMGLKQCRFHGDKEGDWPAEPWSLPVDLEVCDYFPVYGPTRNSDGTFNLQQDLKNFPENYGHYVTG
jgi:hypothetical protein